MKDIKIIGGGLSGLSAAINLAKAGYNVDVFEKRDDCGKRFNGDLEGLENWSSHVDILQEFKSMNIKINFDCDSFKTMCITDGKEIIENTSERPVFYLVKRGSTENCLDQGLKKQALDSGVNIHFNSKESKENMDIISVGTGENKPVGIVRGIRFETESDDIALSLLSNEASDRGYSYLLITKGYGCICSVNYYRDSSIINRYFKKTYEIFTNLMDIDIKNEKNVGGVGCFLIKPKYVIRGQIYTGEAAGLQDLLWGFGMRYAINSGFYAAKSIIENISYKKLVKQNIVPRLKTSVSNRFIVDRFGNRFNDHLLKWAKEDDNWSELLHWGYNPTLYTRAIYPIGKLLLMVKYRERRR